MDNIDINSKLKEIKTEDYIWIIYIGIIILSWYSNSLERRYFIFNDLKSKEEYRKILILIFSILLVVYLYFFYSSLSDVEELKETDSDKKKQLAYLSLIASLLIVISGAIFLYIAYADESIDIELAFN